MTGILIDHLWQSSLVVVLVGLLTLVLRRNRARVRYWLWLTASAKFLVPFTALVALGSQFTWLAPPTAPRMEMAQVLNTAGVSFYRPALRLELPRPQVPESVPLRWTMGSRAVVGVWILGCGLILLNWSVSWRRVATIVRGALPVEDGRVLDMLRRLERFGGSRTPLAIVSSDALLEPGVVGLLRPVLWWPRRLEDHLSDQQVEAILAHELVHVRGFDNLAAAAHMLVRAVFWFNPLVWWIGRRLIDERERACDEAVIRWGSDRQIYAESILKTCEFSIQSPLVSMAGVTGSDLKKRIESIMRSPEGEQLTLLKRLLLIIVSVATVATPVAVGALSPRQSQGQGSAHGPAFEVASVKRNTDPDGPKLFQALPGGRVNLINQTLRELIFSAYQTQDYRILGGPGWLSADRFDIVAKADADVPLPERLSMVRTLLADRFKLAMHTEARELPVYALVLARSDRKPGSKLKLVERACGPGTAPQPPLPDGRPACGAKLGPGSIIAGGMMINALANQLGRLAAIGRPVVNQTGLTGLFDYDLSWTPDQMPQAPSPGVPIDPGGPSIFTALQEQLGLKLEPQRGLVDVLVIDSVDHPTPD